MGRRARGGIAWNLAGAVVTNAMRVVVIAVLGRALSSSEFGVVAAALSVTIVLHHIRDIGIGLALIQRRDLERAHISTAFALSTYTGVGIAVILVALAPWIGAIYNIPESVDVLRALGVIFALRGIGTCSSMMCQRAMNFRTVALVDAAAFTLGSVTSVTLALNGAGAWALVAGYLVEEGLSTVAYLIAYPPPATLRIDRTRMRELFRFGAGQSLVQLAGTFAVYGDNFVVGHALGKEALGYYTRAYDLIKFPSTVFANVVGNVLFPAFARIQDDRPRLGASYRRILFANALVLLPASGMLIAIAPEVIYVLMGDGWGVAVRPFQVLAVTMLFRTSYKVSAMVASAAGGVNRVAMANVAYMVVVIGGALLGVRWGIGGVAVSTAVGLSVVFFTCAYFALQVTQLGARELLRAHLPGVGLGVAALGLATATAELMRGAGSHPGLIVIVTSLAIAVLIVVATWQLVRQGHGDFPWLAGELRRVVRRKQNRQES